MALNRLQIFKPSVIVTPSLLPKYPLSASFNARRLRKISTLPLFCSKSGPALEVSDTAESPSIVNDLLDYLNESWTHFHATAEAKRQLIAAGFHLLNENDEWDLKPGGRYFFTRNMSSLVAFAVGEKYTSDSGFHAIAAHTDSPCLKLKPISSSSKSGFHMMNVQTYGAGLWHTWFDRDLSVAGRAIVKTGDGSFLHKLVKVKRPLLRVPTLAIHLDRYTSDSGFHAIAAHTDSPCLKLKPISSSSKSGFHMMNVQTYGAGLWHTWFDRDLSVAGRAIVKTGDGSFLHKLVKVKRPLLRVPTLAIHLDRTVNTDGFKPNLETHLVPLTATKLEEASTKSEEKTTSSKAAHHPLLMQVLSDELGCSSSDEIVGIELNVCDTQPSCLGGVNNEFIFSGRLDNLASSYCALRALVDSCNLPEDLSNEHAIRMVALFDNEEVGSGSVQGAGASTMFQAMRRIIDCLAHEFLREGDFERAIRQSFLVSADMAHGVHPNFVDKYEEHHRPELQKGLVIKHNANQRYATSAVTAFLFKEIANIHSLPTQEFVVRNDMGCGSTIGPILAAGVGIRTVDCGIAQLSMHSVREMCGKEDVDTAYKHFKAFYQTFSSIDKKLKVDY